MKYIDKKNSGFSAMLIITIIAAVVVVGLVGYVVYDRFIGNGSAKNEQSLVADDMNSVTSSIPNEIVESSDIDKAIDALDKITNDETMEDVDLITKQVSEF